MLYVISVHVHRGKEASGQAVFRHVLPISMYENMKLHSRKLGHLSAVYCVLYDRTGEVIFTVSCFLVTALFTGLDKQKFSA